MSDVVFFLKAFPGARTRALEWPVGTELVGLDPPAGLRCPGADPLCSTAYAGLWQHYGGAQGRFVPTLLAARGLPPDARVSFVGHSAALGLLNPLALREADRIAALVLLDASFGSGKDGYVRFVQEAAEGQRLLVATTGDTGGDDSWMPVWEQAADELGLDPVPVEPRGGVPPPAGGAWQLGDLAYTLRYVPGQPGTRHWEQGAFLPELLGGYLAPYLRGELGGGGMGRLLAYAAVGAAAIAFGRWLARRPRRRPAR